MSRSLICADPAAVGGERRAAAPSMLRPDDPAAVGVVDIVIGEEIGRFRAGGGDPCPPPLLGGGRPNRPGPDTNPRALGRLRGNETAKVIATGEPVLPRAALNP